jgi:DNA-binding NarL/FixJ family response regulator
MTKTRVLLADDHRLVRKGFRSLLDKIPSVHVVAEASDGREALDLIGKLRPQIALLDIAMPNLNGLEALIRIVKEFPETRVIILSMHSNEEYIIKALHSGALGYLLKDAAVGELKLAIETVARNKVFLGSSVSGGNVRHYLEQPDDAEKPLAQLTPRQREILQLIAEGKSTKEIGYMLQISPKTVDAHRAQIMERLNIRDLAGLVRYAIRSGMVSSDV